MPAKRTKVKDYDQFQLRLPDGMRERIKAKADRAEMSMNEAIVYCLEAWFPAPKSLEQKIDDLAKMVAALKRGNELEGQVNVIINEIDSTLREIADGKIDAAESFSKMVSERIEQWDLEESENAESENYNPFDDANYRDPNYVPSQGDWDPRSPNYDPFTDEPLKKKD